MGEAITFRNVSTLLKYFKEPTTRETNLVDVLLAKIPYIGALGCQLFVRQLLEVTQQKHGQESSSNHPMYILITTALLDNDQFSSFPEFINRLKNAFLAHP